uniref:Peptidase M14 domain-containing protein n=1 Tax=Caulobacter sp. (strain K31) TaxID=366602 RepID=B0SXJ2_CAUSK
MRRPLLATAAIILALQAASPGLAQTPLASPPSIVVNAAITTPKQAWSHEAGEDYFLANYTQLVTYWKTLAGQSNRLKMIPVGQTEEGRTQYMMAISSPENLSKLDHYREIARKLSQAKGVDEAQARALAEEGKAIVWIDGGLHASEIVPPQHLAQITYELASRDDAETKRFLDGAIILIGQANPDGMEFVSDWYMRIPEPTQREANWDSLPRLYNKYVGHDDNRDFYMMSQKETENLSRVFFREWFPQIIYNQHQPNSPGTTVVMPPFRDPFNYNYDPLIMSQLSEVGAMMHSRLIAEGKGGSAMRGESPYSTWTNGLERTVTYFHNSIGLLTEIIGHPTPMKLGMVPDRQLPHNDLPLPERPQAWHLKQSIDYSLSLDRAVIDYSVSNKERLLFNTWRMGQDSITKGQNDSWTITPKRIEALKAAAGAREKVDAFSYGAQGVDPKLYDTVLHDPAHRDARGYIIPADQADLPTAVDFLNALIKSGIEVQRATAAFSVNGKTYPSGSFVVKADQAYRPHVLDMFEPQDHPHDLEYPGGPPKPPYDATGYTPALQMAVAFDRITEGFDGPFETVPDVIATPAGTVVGHAGAGWLVSHAPNNAFTLTNRLTKAGAPVFWLKTPTTTQGQTFATGTLWIPASAKADAIVRQAAKDLGLNIRGVDAKPGGEAIRLKPVRVGVVDLYGGLMPTGWTRWLFEKYEMPYTIVRPQRLDAGKLAKDFDVILLPDGAYSAPVVGVRSAFRIKQPDPATIPNEYRSWLGTITPDKTVPQLDRFARDGGSIIAVGSSSAIGSLLSLPVRNVLIDDKDGKPTMAATRDFYIPGSILRAQVDPSQPLAYGMGDVADVYYDNNPSFAVQDSADVKRVAWFSGDLLRSGWALGEKRLDGTASVIDAKVGKGRVMLMGPVVTQRAQTAGTFKLLFNGLYYGPAVSGR